MTEKEKLIQLNIIVEPALDEQIEAIANEQGMLKKRVVSNLIKEGLEKWQARKKNQRNQ